MKHFLVVALVTLLTACGSVPSKPCPTCPDCPGTTTTTCPDQEPCPEAPPCPECPEPPPPPPPPATYPDVDHDAKPYQIISVLADKDTLGLYVSDPNGEFGAAVFAMPELGQKDEYEEVMTLTEGENTYDIGATIGEVDPHGLLVSVLCRREFKSVCSATVVTNDKWITQLKINVPAIPKTFVWQKK